MNIHLVLYLSVMLALENLTTRALHLSELDEVAHEATQHLSTNEMQNDNDQDLRYNICKIMHFIWLL